MKLNQLLPALLLLSSLCSSAQQKGQVYFRSGNITPAYNINQDYLDSFNRSTPRFMNRSLVVLQFQSIPGATSRKILSSKGIELLEYIPERSYTAIVTGDADLQALQQASVVSLFTLQPKDKMSEPLASGRIPSSSIKIQGTVDVWVSFPRMFTTQEVMQGLAALNIDVLSKEWERYHILSLRLATGRLNDLAALPFIDYVQAAPGGDRVLNFNSRAVSRANYLNASVANGGRGLNGEGIVLGVGDNADVQTHPDFAGRLINRAGIPVVYGHGHHTTGTVAGAGNGNELFRGYAPKSTIVSQAFNGIILNAPVYVSDYGMVLTNNSYGDNIECGYYGTYDLYSRLLDQMAFDLPELQNVFSAGNSGLQTCGLYQPGYHTVLGGYQTAKNVISVGAANDSGLVAGFSSKGPVKDGRVKPEIVAMGQLVASAWAGGIYGYNNGTSMSGPAVTGGLALLYQRYRQLNGGANPKNALMKALLCNGAQDRGNTGPDYYYGFGWLNLMRSIDMMEQGHYYSGNVTNGAMATQNISIPAGTTALKVMLYWNDPAASPLSAHNLVNDLDLEVADPSSNILLPNILDSANANVGNLAVSGVDHFNNMEQVVVNNPAAGNYTIRVKGTTIAQNPSQDFYVVYDPIPAQLLVTSPAGGEGLVPSTQQLDMIRISWEAYGYPSGTVTIEFSADNGSTWSTIASGVDINRRIFSWRVPNTPTNQGRIRITKEGSGETTMTNPFIITGLPTVTLANVQCEGYATINWTAVPAATDYEVMWLRGDSMQGVATTTALTYTFHGLSKDSLYYFSVRARIGGKAGRRGTAVSRQPNSGTCAGSISNNDLKMDAVLSPVSGRKFTSSQPGAAMPVTVRIRNLDDAAVNNFDLGYSINGSPFITEHVTASVAANATYTYTFTATADFSVPGNYNLAVVVKNSTSDPETVNDTMKLVVKSLDNQPLDLTSDFMDDMETAADVVYDKDTTGLQGIDRYDLSRSSVYGRLRTYINSGMAYSGTKALHLDMSRYDVAGNTNNLTGTYNLINYNAATNDIRLDFQFSQHGQFPDNANRVWIRGNDAAPWIEVYNIDDNQAEAGIYKRSSSIEVAHLLANNGQAFGTSFQVKWGQWGQLATTDPVFAAGYSLDDIRLYQVFNDMQMLTVDEPVTASCGLSSTGQVKVSVRNSSNAAIANIPVRYRVNNGSWIVENIPSIAAQTTMQYSFVTSYDFSNPQSYTIEAVVDLAADSYHENDTAVSIIVNTPVISTFPYLQNFEAGNGYWYSGGKNSSWEYGTPASSKISGAASGARAWKTRLAGNYNDNEFSYLYSPCYDISGMSQPTLSFSFALDAEDCGAQMCDGAWMEYSADGISWTKLGASGEGTNWYNDAVNEVWSKQDFTNWHVATIPLPAGMSRLRVRFVMHSDPAVNREGLGIDDIHIYDNTLGIYDGVTMGAPVNQVVSGNNWIDFVSGGKLIASINPDNQVMGATEVQAYINAGTVRHTISQYYLDRNIAIRPANAVLSDSVTVRFYFLDSEVDSLLNATGCVICTKPSSAYTLGVSKYSDPDDSFENGTINDDNQGSWLFILPEKVVKVPFDKGYYAEFRVKDFSEFWLNNGSFDNSTPLPVKFMEFTADKTGNNALLQWKVAGEADVDRYEIEVARGNEALQNGNYSVIGSVASGGNTALTRNYTFLDQEADKTGTRYYRIRIVNQDGSFSYSGVRPVVFDAAVLWQVYPNPSQGIFNLVFQLNNNEQLSARILDAKGRTIRKIQKQGSGFQQKLVIDLSTYAAGVYLLQIDAGGRKQQFKLFRQ